MTTSVFLETNNIIVTDNYIEYYLTVGGKDIIGGNNVYLKFPLTAFSEKNNTKTVVLSSSNYDDGDNDNNNPMTTYIKFNGDIGTQNPYIINSSFTQNNSNLSKRTYFSTNDISGDYDKILTNFILLKGSLQKGNKLFDNKYPLLYLYLVVVNML